MNLLNISDIAKHLETKLNQAIVNEIAEAKATNTSTYFDNERETFRFRLYIDTGTYKGFDYLKRGALPNADGSYNQADISLYPTNKYVRYINGIFSVNESNIEGTTSVNLTFSTSVEFLIPLDEVKDDTYHTEEMVASVRRIIDNAMALNYYGDFDGFNLGVNYGLGLTGARALRGHIGDSVTLTAYFVYSFVENGINSTEVIIELDNGNDGYITLGVPRQGFSRVEVQEADNDLEQDDFDAKVTSLSSQLTITFDMPSAKDTLGDIVNEFIAEGTNPARLLNITYPNSTGTKTVTKIVKFAESTLNTEKTLNASNTVILVEALAYNEVTTLTPLAQAYVEANNGE